MEYPNWGYAFYIFKNLDKISGLLNYLWIIETRSTPISLGISSILLGKIG